MPYVGYVVNDRPPISLWHFNDSFLNSSGTFGFSATGLSLSTTNRFGGHSLDPVGAGAVTSFNPGPYLAQSWTIEFWARISSLTTLDVMINRLSGGSAALYRYTSVGSPTQVHMQISDSIGNQLSGTLPVGTQAVDTFYHCALVRNKVAGTYDTYMNGDRLMQFTSATNLPGTDYNIIITESVVNASFIDELAFSDFARYSGATYTPRTSELPNP